MKTIRPLCWAVLLLLVVTGCERPVPVTWHEEGEHRWRELAFSSRGRIGFTRLRPRRTGIDFTNAVSHERSLQNRHLTYGAGVALGDVDGDGLVDMYLARVEGPNALYRNLGGWRFEDIAAEAGVALPERASTGTALADVDGDGDLDLLVTALGGPNALYVNDGTGAFTERIEEAGLASRRGSVTMALADVDADGDLDLYVANYKVATVLDLFSPAQRAFDQVVHEVDGEPTIVPGFEHHYQLDTTRGRVFLAQRAEPDQLLLNDGTGRFEEVSFTSGRFLDEDGRPLTAVPHYFGLAARFHDVDDDGDPDLYVCNDFHHPDQFWINDGTGVFQAIPRLALRKTSTTSMALDFSDIDRDGNLDLFVLDMLALDPGRRKAQLAMHASVPLPLGAIDNRPQYSQNTLFVNRGDGTYAEIANFAGVAASDWSWGVQFLDVDLDGYEDALVTTGHVWDMNDGDANERLGGGSMLAWQRQLLEFPDYRSKNVAFRNNGDRTFSEVGSEWGFAKDEDFSHGIASGDLDGDGDLDVVVTRLGTPVAVLRNNATAPRLAVRLIGAAPNTQAVGAKISVQGGAVPEQTKEVTLGGMYLSSSEPLYTFAANDGDELRIVVRWRGGGETILSGVQPNRLYEISEPVADTGADSAPPAPTRATASPYFADVSSMLGHSHVESVFDDFARQPLLPNALSNLGPGVTWYDVDRDGDDDLLIPSGRGGQLAYYRNDGGRLRHVDLGMGESAYDQTTVLGLPSGPNSTALLLGQSSYEARTPSEALSTPGVLHLDMGVGARSAAGSVTEAVPGDTSAVGPLALADVDGDGDLDLFVGGRVIPAVYPVAATARLFRNEGGRFVRDAANAEVLSSIGLASAAVFSDVDADGDPDLILAIDWGPITLLLNDGGRFSRAGESYALASFRSRWNGISTGDFNGDGLIDIAATSWGRNTTHAVDEHPLLAYYSDFDRNGRIDVILAQFDEGLKTVAPLERFSRLIVAMPFVRRQTPTYQDYADATLEEVVDRDLQSINWVAANTLDHMVFLNRGDAFEGIALPREAQMAPAFHVGVADFDGDGVEDLFLSQNFFATEVGTPRHDAGRALWLRGDGTGGFAPVSSQESGVIVYGDQRGAAFADFDADGRIDLAVSQNAARTKLFHNQRATPGLRVRLRGGPGNPNAVGALIRIMYPDGLGPAREVRSGSGYWSQDGAVQVLGLRGEATGVWVRWPGGAETETPVPPGAREITIPSGEL